MALRFPGFRVGSTDFVEGAAIEGGAVRLNEVPGAGANAFAGTNSPVAGTSIGARPTTSAAPVDSAVFPVAIGDAGSLALRFPGLGVGGTDFVEGAAVEGGTVRLNQGSGAGANGFAGADSPFAGASIGACSATSAAPVASAVFPVAIGLTGGDTGLETRLDIHVADQTVPRTVKHTAVRLNQVAGTFASGLTGA